MVSQEYVVCRSRSGILVYISTLARVMPPCTPRATPQLSLSLVALIEVKLVEVKLVEVKLVEVKPSAVALLARTIRDTSYHASNLCTKMGLRERGE